MGRYIVGFGPADTLTWWARLLHPEFQHCWVAKDNGVFFEKLECLVNVIHTEILLYDTPLLEGQRYIGIHLDPDPTKHFGIFHHLNCVSLVKKFLGICDYKIQTPKQLYNYLLTIGGLENDVNVRRGTRYK